MNLKKTTSHVGLQHTCKKININFLAEDITFLGYMYKDTVRGKDSIVHEISFSNCFPSLDREAILSLVNQENFSYAEQLYNIAKDSHSTVKTVNDIYIVEDYVDLVQKAETFRSHGLMSNRNTIIYFKPTHCFQSMQFMKGDNRGKVIVNMRSCNLTENFLIDLALSWIVANNVFNETYSKIDVVMNIASLHVLEPV